jgi:hypothetical protein
MIKYTSEYKFVLDSLWFAYRGEIFKGGGFMEWNPTDGFHIDALLDKNFAPVDSLKTLGQTIINDRNDAFTIWLKIRGVGAAIAPNVFPLAQKKSFIPDNHLSIDQDRLIFFFKGPKECYRNSESWSGSAVFLTKNKIEFSDCLKQETSLGGQLIESQSWTGLTHEAINDFSVSGRYLTDNSFELNWSLPKSSWTKTNAWNFGESARRALSIIFAQTIWITESKITRANREIFEFRKKREVESLYYNYRPLIDIDSNGPKQREFNKNTFLKLVAFFTKGGHHADICWKIFHQMTDASRQNTTQGRELFLSTILEAIFRTINNRPFIAGGHYGREDREKDMASFQQNFLTAKWDLACKKALELHARLRHRNAHPDWLTIPSGGLSKEELKESTKDLIFLSRFYGYMILALAGFKDLEPLFPIVRFSDDPQQPEPTKL